MSLKGEDMYQKKIDKNKHFKMQWMTKFQEKTYLQVQTFCLSVQVGER